MRLVVVSGAAVAVVAVAGCGGSEHGSSNTPDAIAASIASVCKTKVTRTALPSEPGHGQFEELALNKTVIGCQGKPGNQSEYTRFADRRTALSALDSIRLRPAHVESFCVAGSEAFTTDFVGSDP